MEFIKHWLRKYINQLKYTLREKCYYLDIFLLCTSPCSVRMRENTNQKNSEYGYFSRSVSCKFSLSKKISSILALYLYR